MSKRIYLILILAYLKSFSQQDAQFTNYMYNLSVVNPAYATSNFDKLQMGLLHRQQWINISGAPQTSTFFAHYALNDKSELGVTFFNDNIGKGVLKENKITFDYAYILNLDNYNKLSFGIKGGLNMLNINFNGFKLESGDQFSDELFNENQSRIYPNVGTGIYYYSKDKYLGISVPNLLKSSYLNKQDNIYSKASEELHYYLTGGIVLDLNRNLKYKPSF
ncbi:MAG: type IX secretion system membrane protein PorP/SprF [Flavobacterium sp.]|nr:type IX secretion system membrane protein PorP/SprF [Flavobacterium sp.]